MKKDTYIKDNCFNVEGKEMTLKEVFEHHFSKFKYDTSEEASVSFIDCINERKTKDKDLDKSNLYPWQQKDYDKRPRKKMSVTEIKNLFPWLKGKSAEELIAKYDWVKPDEEGSEVTEIEIEDDPDADLF